MSLVNDMLKDLDERRRGVPVKGNAAKKLTPASDRSRLSASSRLPVFAAVIGAVVVILLVLWLTVVDRDNTGTLSDMRTEAGDNPVRVSYTNVAQSTGQPDADALGTASTSAMNSSPAANISGNIAQENAPQESAAAATIAALEARLAELEAVNRATSTQANLSTTGQSADWAPIDWNANATAPVDAGAGTRSVTEETYAQRQIVSQNTLSQVAPGQPGQVQQAPTQQNPLQPNEPLTTVERQSREMPLSERDRLTVQEALTLWSQGQQLSALQALDSFAYENPEAHQSRETLAKLLIRQGEVERALQATEIGLQIAPSHAGYKKVKARILIGQSNVPEALALLSATPPSVSNDPEYHSLLATAQLAGGEYTQAIQSYRALLRLDDTRLEKAPLWYGLGSAQQRLGNLDEARQAYQQALQQPNLSANLRAQIERRLSGQ